MSDEKKGDGLVIGIISVLALLVMVGVCGGGALFFFRAARVQTQVIMERDQAIMQAEQARDLAEQTRAAAERAVDAEKAARGETTAEKHEEPGDATKLDASEKREMP